MWRVSVAPGNRRWRLVEDNGDSYNIVGWVRCTPEDYEVTDDGILCNTQQVKYLVKGDVEKLQGQELLLPVLYAWESTIEDVIPLDAEYPSCGIISVGVVTHLSKPIVGSCYTDIMRWHYHRPYSFAGILQGEPYWTIGLCIPPHLYYVRWDGKMGGMLWGDSKRPTFILLRMDTTDHVINGRPLSNQDFTETDVTYNGYCHENRGYRIYGLHRDVTKVYLPNGVRDFSHIMGLLPDGGTIGLPRTNVITVPSVPITKDVPITEDVLQEDLKLADHDELLREWCTAVRKLPPSVNGSKTLALLKMLNSW